MTGALATLRSRHAEVLAEMDTLSRSESPTAEQRARFRDLDTEITTLREDIAAQERHAEREARAAAARAEASGGTATTHTASGVTVTSEPQVYGRGSGQSYFRDLGCVAARRGDYLAAQERLSRHGAELAVEMPRRAEIRRQAADRAYERAIEGHSPAERRAADAAMERMVRAGANPFESRALNRVDGTGGYLVPPLWLVDDLVPYLRAGREFADLWRGMPLPQGTDSINIPRLTIGSATGPQAADGAAVNGRDMADAFVTAKVQTISGQMDVAIQLLDQSPIAGFDEMIFRDLAADYNLQLSGQCYVGSNSAGQINGIWPSGGIANTNGIYIPNTNNTAAQTWVNGGGASFSVTNSVFQGSGQMLSVIARTRLRPATAWVWHPWVWYYLTTQVDQQGRPLVVPGTPNNVGFNQVAIDSDGPMVEGPVGYYMGLPVYLDPNMPTTFGGTTAPQMGTISAGQFAPTPGSGGTPNYTPLLAGVWDDLFLWEGEMRTRTLDQVLSGNLQMRFQLFNYVASLPNRYQAYADVTTGTGPTTVAKQNSAVSYATLTQNTANGVLSMTGQGF